MNEPTRQEAVEIALEAYEARETFEAIQNDSNGRGTQETVEQ